MLNDKEIETMAAQAMLDIEADDMDHDNVRVTVWKMIKAGYLKAYDNSIHACEMNRAFGGDVCIVCLKTIGEP